MDISKFMKFINASEHLADIELGVSFLKDARVVEQRPEITPWNILHGQIYELGILKSVE